VDLWSVLLKPLFAGLACALSAKGVWLLTQEGLGSRAATVLAICVAVLIYVAVVLAIRGVPKNDIKMLPKGEKIAELLAKCHLLG
jgi:stage V sporulation protein B